LTELMKDILNEPGELKKSLAYTLGTGKSALDKAVAIIREARNLYVAGIGSSWHAGMAVTGILHAGGCPAFLFDASEFLHFVPIVSESALIILSRSGKSAEVVGLVTKARQRGAKIIAITNTPDSPLGQGADVILKLEAAFDHLVSITMYSALTLVGGMLADAAVGSLDESLGHVLATSLSEAERVLEHWCGQIETSGWFVSDAPTYFLARGGSLASCHEAKLLWEEVAKAPACSMTTGGFRHGAQESVREGMRYVLWVDGELMRDQDLKLAREIRDAGGRVIVIGQDVPPQTGNLVFRLPSVPNKWQFLIDVFPAQLSAEHLSRLRGVNCDSFRLCPYIIESEEGLCS